MRFFAKLSLISILIFSSSFAYAGRVKSCLSALTAAVCLASSGCMVSRPFDESEMKEIWKSEAPTSRYTDHSDLNIPDLFTGVGVIAVEKKGAPNTSGSGGIALITSQLLLTAAHNFYSTPELIEEGFAGKVSFSVGFRFLDAQGRNVPITVKEVIETNVKEDWALLKIEPIDLSILKPIPIAPEERKPSEGESVFLITENGSRATAPRAGLFTLDRGDCYRGIGAQTILRATYGGEKDSWAHGVCIGDHKEATALLSSTAGYVWPGDSGFPVVNTHGEVVGVTHMVIGLVFGEGSSERMLQLSKRFIYVPITDSIRKAIKTAQKE